ncbi:hypothetical protein AB205_0134080 [Aquarana catesbeiana]|uniref:Uncharacterized protein n=1 Tax=Aquarana catesbeiana TaxID=8400 RepID=A0A2G9QKS7_AQUCT|nr:hypothetical protein AB205_0134080 [Aquarana catesbeiana]
MELLNLRSHHNLPSSWITSVASVRTPLDPLRKRINRMTVVHSESLGPHSKVLGLNNSHTNMDEEVLVEKGSKSIPGSGMGTASVQDRHNRRKRHGE